MENATRFLKQAFNIREGRAPYHVIRKRFVNGARLTGSHLCILIIAMLIASIGLDIDSDIAIVGAMLICPLMGSVLAMAYGIATLDREITVEAIAGLALQMAFCLITSTLYFKLSPLGTTTAAIIDNSTPTVWDLAVALAGGFAGGLGNSRDQEPATLIAGVAVATALMPPLCAAGYGIAIASGSLFLSALYEFGINVVFIALAAIGVPVLANFQGGPSAIFGKTGGYAIGYILTALITALLVRVLGRKFWALCAAMVVGCAACYLLGTIWFMILTGADLVSALGWCVLPYLPGDVIKIALAAILTIQLDKRMPKI